jgi:hypothetical protein
MKNRERIIVSSVFAVLVFGWLGFLLHTSPDFAGSGLGAVFGISGALLMLVPLVYVLAKRVPFFKERITRYVSLQTWLSIHIYTGIVGALLSLIHTGHKYNSPLGIALTAAMLLVVLTGYALRYLTPFVNLDMKDKLLLLQTARGDLDSAWGVLETSPADAKALPKARLLTAGLASLGIDLSTAGGPAAEVTRLAESVADLEYAVRSDEFFKRCFSWALTVHIVLSMLFYVLLGLHIWAGIHFGLRWFS